MKDSIRYKWNSGKPCKAWFFVKGFLKDMVPNRYYQWKKESLLRQLDLREDKEYILERVAYYNKVNQPYTLPSETRREHRGHYYVFLDKIRHFRPGTFHKAYYLDLQDAVRYFDRSLRIAYTPGDVYFTPTFPTLVKSRLLKEDNHHSVILKLDKLRHFMVVNNTVKSSINDTARTIFFIFLFALKNQRCKGRGIRFQRNNGYVMFRFQSCFSGIIYLTESLRQSYNQLNEHPSSEALNRL